MSDTTVQKLLERWYDSYERGQELSAEEICAEHPEHLANVLLAIGKARTLEVARVEAEKSKDESEDDAKADNCWQSRGIPIPGYRLEDDQPFASGGSGSVWRATHGSTPVVLKKISLQKELGQREEEALELHKEVSGHPHLLEIRGYWIQEKTLILALEQAEMNLAERKHECEGGKIPIEELMLYMREAAEALDYLNASQHQLGDQTVSIQHRDIKPSNLLLKKGHLKIGDFGLAKVLETSEISQFPALSPRYAPPERFTGETEATSDQYSLAVAYVELRTGRHPFQVPLDCWEAWKKAHSEELPDLNGLSVEEVAVIERALAKDSTERWGSCTEFIEALQQDLTAEQQGSNPMFDLYRDVPASLQDEICHADAYIETWTRGFVGREFVFEALDRFLADPQNPSGYFVVRGEPGIGKSALMAQLVKTRGYVHHFNTLENNPRQFVRNVCAQIIGRFDLPHGQLPRVAEEDPGKFLTKILREASQKLTTENQLVIVVDALDEVKDRDTESNLLFLPVALDRNVFFIVTTRPKKEVRFQLRVGHVKDFDFGDEVLSENNKEDAECFIRSWLQNDSVQEWMKANECGEEQFVCELLVKSQGNFMYLHHVLPSIADPNSHLRPRQPFRIQDLPQGLLAFYHQHWEQMQREDLALFERLYEPVVCVLAAVEELVTVDILSEVTGLGEREVRRVLQEWWEFLYRTTEPNGLELYRLYHRSFQEFLEKEVDGLRKYHDMIGDFALKELGME